MKNNLRIAMVSAEDPRDRRTWSGCPSFMIDALEKHVGTVDCFGPTAIPWNLRDRLESGLNRLRGKQTCPGRTLNAAKHYARDTARKLEKSSYDLIFSPAASAEISLLETEVPVIYTSDATFQLVSGAYAIFSDLPRKTVQNEEFFEKQAISKSSLLLYPSSWASRSAVEQYGAARDKVRVIPYGANIAEAPPEDAATGKKIDGPLNLLFLAKEWERKGGDTAFDALNALRERGIDARLIVCGITPPKGFESPHLEVIPYLDKNNEADRKRFEQVLLSSHLLLLPTRVECYGIVFCEANAYGLPVFASTVGGIPTVVRDGENGYLLPPDADGKAYAGAIAQVMSDSGMYTSLNQGARKRYDSVLNWDAWGQGVRKAVQEKLGI